MTDSATLKHYADVVIGFKSNPKLSKDNGAILNTGFRGKGANKIGPNAQRQKTASSDMDALRKYRVSDSELAVILRNAATHHFPKENTSGLNMQRANRREALKIAKEDLKSVTDDPLETDPVIKAAKISKLDKEIEKFTTDIANLTVQIDHLENDNLQEIAKTCWRILGGARGDAEKIILLNLINNKPTVISSHSSVSASAKPTAANQSVARQEEHAPSDTGGSWRRHDDSHDSHDGQSRRSMSKFGDTEPDTRDSRGSTGFSSDSRKSGGGYEDRKSGGYDDRRGGSYEDRRGGGRGYQQDRRGGGYDDRRGGYDKSGERGTDGWTTSGSGKSYSKFGSDSTSGIGDRKQASQPPKEGSYVPPHMRNRFTLPEEEAVKVEKVEEFPIFGGASTKTVAIGTSNSKGAWGSGVSEAVKSAPVIRREVAPVQVADEDDDYYNDYNGQWEKRGMTQLSNSVPRIVPRIVPLQSYPSDANAHKVSWDDDEYDEECDEGQYDDSHDVPDSWADEDGF